MTIRRRIAAAGGFATGAALVFAPLASADPSNDWLSAVDGLLSGASPAASPADFQISFNGTDLFSTAGNEASAHTTAGQYDLAIAYGNGATAYAEGGYGNYALASGTDANAEAGSLASGATGNNFDTAVDIGNNGSGYLQDNTGAYAGNGARGSARRVGRRGKPGRRRYAGVDAPAKSGLRRRTNVEEYREHY